MSLLLTSEDKKEFKVSRDLAILYSPLIKTLAADKDAKDIPLSRKGQMLELVIEYMTHHGATESACPKPPMPPKATLASMAKDGLLAEWDVAFIERCSKLDPDLVRIVDTVDYLGMSHLHSKLSLAIAINLRDKKGLDSDALAEELAKLSVADGAKKDEAKDAKDAKKDEKKDEKKEEPKKRKPRATKKAAAAKDAPKGDEDDDDGDG